MPTNVTPEYKAAEAAYRKARDPAEKLELLKEMHRTIPKHKGTEHLRADIKTRIKELTAEVAAPRKTGARGGPPTVIRQEGAAQVALIGPPNSGKSALHKALTGSHAEVGPYPFTTQYPQPGMLVVDDIQIQVVDLPAVSPEHPIPWIGNALQPADGALLVVDLSIPGCVASVVAMHEVLAVRRVELISTWPAEATTGRDDESDPFAIVVPTALVAAKCDLVADAAGELAVLAELVGVAYPTLTVSVETGEGLDRIGEWLFEHLGIARVYTKIPGQSPDMSRPYTLRLGDTVIDVARLVHRDIAATFKYARLWGKGSFEGQQVGRDHEIVDGDVLELHY